MNPIQRCCAISTRDQDTRQSPYKRGLSLGLLVAAVYLLCTATLLQVVNAAEAERAEIKLLVQPDKIVEARRLLNLTDAAVKRHKIYFVETPHFNLGKFGLILQLRAEANDWMEVTVKFRPTDSSRAIDNQWEEKLEKESEWLVGKGKSFSYSLKQHLGGVERTNHPDQNLDILFSDDQKALVNWVVNHQANIAELKVFGPIAAEIWEQSEDAVGDKISAELWTFGNKQLFELSRKTSAGNLKADADNFEQALKSKGIDVESDPEERTRKVLEYYSHFTHAKPAYATKPPQTIVTTTPSAESDSADLSSDSLQVRDLQRVIETQNSLIKALKSRVKELESKKSSSEQPE